MLTPVTATTFHRPMGVGKTAPSLVTCVSADGSEVELVVKFAGGCEAGIGSLLREAVGRIDGGGFGFARARTFFGEGGSRFCGDDSRIE